MKQSRIIMIVVATVLVATALAAFLIYKQIPETIPSDPAPEEPAVGGTTSGQLYPGDTGYEDVHIPPIEEN